LSKDSLVYRSVVRSWFSQ